MEIKTYEDYISVREMLERKYMFSKFIYSNINQQLAKSELEQFKNQFKDYTLQYAKDYRNGII